MKICLLTCSAPFLIDEKVFPPLGLMAVGTALRLQGHDVTIKGEPDDSHHFALGPTTSEYPSALKLLQYIKSQNDSSRVVIGGPHAVVNVVECLADGFDVVAIGDGENITADTFMSKGRVDLGQKPLDEYPIINRSLVDIHSYQYKIRGRLATTVVTARGCPYQCGFCSKTEKGTRYRSIKEIDREILYLREHWNYHALMFYDDTLTLNRKRAEQICQILEGYGILWRCLLRGDLVVRHGQELVNVMANSGCVEVAIGIESGSDRILKSINKGESTITIRIAIGMLRQAGIRVKGLFIIGLPGENHNSLNETRQFLEEVPLDDVDFSIYQPYQGSPIWDNQQEYDVSWDVLPANARFFKGKPGEYQCIVRTSALTAQQIIETRDELEMEFKCR